MNLERPGDRGGVVDRIERLCSHAETLGTDDVIQDVSAVRSRLSEPLRVAIAGRVKAGKSTLLNALVGERLAATDASECTSIVTWYRHGSSYGVTAVLRTGESRELRFGRGSAGLDIDLDVLDPDDVEHLEVTWPTSRLSRMTLIDTPGLGSVDTRRSERAKQLLGVDVGRPSEVDAVIYLLRHLHSSDRAFLDAFLDRSLSRPSPVNAVAVLSRADEIGAGRLDALESAGAIADRLAADRRVRAVCATVLPVAGLIAETGQTLRESEVVELRELCRLGRDELELLLVSVDRFCAPGVTSLSIDTRRSLLARLGLFGVRFALSQLGADSAITASELARRLVTASGIAGLSVLLDEQLAPLADVLKARSALVALGNIATSLSSVNPASGRELESAIERVEADTHELAELRLLHLLFSGQVEVDHAGRAEIERLVRAGDSTGRLGLDADTEVAQQRAVALERLEAWRVRAAQPLTARVDAEASEIIAQCYERLFVGLDRSTGAQ